MSEQAPVDQMKANKAMEATSQRLSLMADVVRRRRNMRIISTTALAIARVCISAVARPLARQTGRVVRTGLAACRSSSRS